MKVDNEFVFGLADRIAKLQKAADERPQPQQPRRQRAPRYIKHLKEDQIVDRLRKALDEAETLQKFLTDREKANKREEKKEEKKGIKLEHMMALLVAGYPIIGLVLYLLWK